MLNKLKQKLPAKNLSLINASYFNHDFGISKAGFKAVEMNWRMENTTIIITKK
jgi:hypothetical protein